MISSPWKGVLATAALLLSGAASEAQVPTPASGAIDSLQREQTSAATAAPMVRELMCRGGSGGFQTGVTSRPSPRADGYVELRLDYRRSAAQGGADWLALEPGTCTWNPWGDPSIPDEPGHVLFDTEEDAQSQQVQMLHGAAQPRDTTVDAAEWHPDAVSIPRYLTDPDHFWIFYVEDRGPQVAISHGPWKPSLTQEIAGRGLEATPPPTSREAPTPTGARRVDDSALPVSREAPNPLGTSRIGDERPPATTDITSNWRVHGVRVTPEAFGATIRFRGAATPEPVVRVFMEAPVGTPGAGGIWSSNYPLHTMVTTTRSGSTWEHVAVTALDDFHRLDPGTRYQYLIEVPADGVTLLEPQQVRGEFTTLDQHIRVVFEELRVIDDADAGLSIDGDDAGEITFAFAAGDARRVLPEADWSSGDRRRLPGVSLELVANSTTLGIAVVGYEDDEDLLTQTVGEILNGAVDLVEDAVDELREVQLVGSIVEMVDPDWQRSDPDPDRNTAAARVSLLRGVEGRSGTIPFQIRSAAQDGLEFEVTGRIEVTRR